MSTPRAQDHDQMITRNRAARKQVFVGFAAAMILVFVFLGVWVGSVLDFSGSKLLFGGIGAVSALSLIIHLTPRFFVLVPQTAAFVTTDALSKSTEPNVPYGPGLHVSFPWEQRAESGNITLDVMTIDYKELVPTNTVGMIVEGALQFKFDLEHIEIVIGLDKKAIEKGFATLIRMWITSKFAQVNGEEYRGKTEEATNEMETFFMEGLRGRLLGRYGLTVEGAPVGSIDFTEEVQRTRDARHELEMIADSLAFLLGYESAEALWKAKQEGKVTAEEISRARDDAMAASGNVKKEVKRLDISGLSGSSADRITAGLLGG